MGFVQADPIRSPARAQDLILRHRVTGYRAGDLERKYPQLDMDEDVLYAYGFVSAATRELLHPRHAEAPDERAREVLEFVRRSGPTHPRALLIEFGDGRERNAWGGHSRATTRVLEMLHYRGLLRVARRDAGVRVYQAVHASQAAQTSPEPIAPEERIKRLALLTARIFEPLPEASLRAILSHLRHSAPALTGRRTIMSQLLATGELERGDVDGVAYVWTRDMSPVAKTVPRTVRFLAPFDPVVWDRRRFEQLWGWPYRFEAYTPAGRRQFGYYALPLLWADRVIGWANISARGGQLDVELGFVNGRPRDHAFTRALDAEVERVRDFLGLSASDGE